MERVAKQRGLRKGLNQEISNNPENRSWDDPAADANQLQQFSFSLSFQDSNS